jgi:hypothetical protein
MFTLASSFTYGDAVIFSGANVKALKQNLDLNGIVTLNSGSVNPAITATSANKGSLYLNTAGSTVYVKQDSGSSTNWTPLSTTLGTVTSVGMTVPSVLSVSPSSITSNGTFALSYSGTALPIANGGTGQTSANPAFNALSPLTTKGDFLSYSTVNARVAVPGDNGRMIPDSSQTTGWRAATYLQLQNGRPGKNYIQYADFNNSATTGWSLGHIPTITNGLPASNSPTFGSGASGNLSISAITSSQLAGIGSLGYVSSAATTVGDMVASSAYTVDAEDEAKVLTVRFYYINHSGTIAATGGSGNSFAWAVWDATNSVWLPTAGQFCITQTTTAGYCTGTVQTGVSTASVRLVVYNATATSGAATMYFDDFYLGPQTSTLGPVLEDWSTTKYSLVFAPSFGTPGTTLYRCRREGDSLHCIGYFTLGTPSGLVAYIGLPTGLTLDFANKFGGSPGTNIQRMGEWNAMGATTQGLYNVSGGAGAMFSDGSTNNELFMSYQTGTTAQQYVQNNGNNIQNTGGLVWFEFTAPVTGWSSSVVMSQDTDTRVIGAHLFLTSNVTPSANTPVIFDTVDFDTAGAYSTSTGLYKIPVTGKYSIQVTAQVSGTASLYVQKNGTGNAAYLVTGTSGNVIGGSVILSFNAGDTFSINVDSGSNTIDGGVVSNLSVQRISGPAVVAATESVSAHYHASASTITSSLGLVTFSTKDTDTHNAYASGLYTCPVTGHYAVSAGLYMTAATVAVSSVYEIAIYLAGAIYTANQDYLNTGTTEKPATISISDASVYCLAGQTISIEASNNGTTPSISSSNNFNYFSVARTGN